MRHQGTKLWTALLVPLTLCAHEPLKLTLSGAIDRALGKDGAARVRLAAESAEQARLRALQARSFLLPDFSAQVSHQSTTRNLQAFGINFSSPLFRVPTFVGPFNVFDARASVTQTVFDFGLLRRYQAAQAGRKAAGAESEAAEELVTGQVARAYIAALRARADLDTARANIELAEAVLRLAESQKAAGAGTGIEITRARVQLANQNQRRIVADNQLRAAFRQLLRAMNAPLDTPVELADALGYAPLDDALIRDAESSALAARKDLKAQQGREETARLSASSVKWERLPSVAAFADYGSIGSGPGNALPTRTYGVAMRVPLFDGGRRDARRAESESQLRQERIRTGDLREQVRLEVRLALDSLRSAGEQVQVAEEGLTLAENELAQSRRRFQAGVAPSLEVTDAQTRLERARDNRVQALFLYNQARIDLGQATGQMRRVLP